MQLDASNSWQVVNARSIWFLTGEANVLHYIFTGAPWPDIRPSGDSLSWFSSPSGQSDDIQIKIGNVSGKLLDYTIALGLSSIQNSETVFHFQLNNTSSPPASLEQTDSGDLILKIRTFAYGLSRLQSFYYHVDAKIIIDEPTISGIIRWNTQELTHTRIQDLFGVSANMLSTVPPASGGVNIMPQETPIANGIVSAPPAPIDNFMFVPFIVRNAPLNIDLKVGVVLGSGALEPVAKGVLISQIKIGQSAGPQVFRLTVSQRKVDGLIFDCYIQKLIE